MTELEIKELVSYRLGNAKDTLREVGLHIENELWNTAVNRLYYACFYAVSALLAKQGIFTKTHSGTIKMFSLHFVKPGIVNEDLGIFYSKIFDMRQNADYEDFLDYEKNEVIAILKPAEELIGHIADIIGRD